MNDIIKVVAVIPHYNHSDTVSAVTDALLALNLPVWIVDDGSDEPHRAVLRELQRNASVNVIFCAHNGGKGSAVKAGFKQALQAGFTHALQVDADGQHQLQDARNMCQKMHENPTALICGRPLYGADAPKSRLYGRKISNFWIALNTVSFDIPDGMCGFRLYPLASTVQLINEEYVGDGMDFDIEILVRCHWRKMPMIWLDTPVRYGRDGVSHFRPWADNWLLSKMHARLFFGMLARLFKGKRR
ncbi:glycosyltransferase family 2 protein [Necropsobacter massiliensis]|uniref:glycosyltransferase family 2 protein n=1 Tax=Necropsobacter massiliensis TaxID=1400001 RepID=UPI00059630BC